MRDRRKLIILGQGTHTIMIERNRLQLFDAVQQFLEQDFGSLPR